jgi:glutamate carboxypeptidase
LKGGVDLLNQALRDPSQYGGFLNEETSSVSWLNLHRPPKIPRERSDELLNKTIAIGRLLGQELGIIDSGGGTDGLLAEAAGLPSLGVLGIEGSGAHSNREEARLSSLLQRARLSAVLISRLAAGQ